MKKLLFISILFVLALTAKSQVPLSINEGEPVIVYALPKTELCIVVETEKIYQHPGAFYRYSDRYLAAKKVITQEKTSYRLKSIKISTRAIPDPARTYSFIPSVKLQSSHLSVNSKGILCGLNVPAETETVQPVVAVLPVKESSRQDALLPLGEESMMAGSEAKMAEGAAKQIYRIRESRLSLLTADQDKLPADGESFKSMFEGMSILERELTELFVGKTTSETQTQTLYLTPSAAVANDVLFRLSALNGMVNSDDLSGSPYYISIQPTDIRKNGNKSKGKSEKAGIYTVLPASTLITIGDGVNTVLSEQFLMPQFGMTIPLDENLLKQSHVKVQVDTQTGRLLRVE